MTGTVSTASIIMMGVAGALAFIIPIGLFFYFKKKGADILPFFVGCAVMLVFALIIEAAIHQVIFKTNVGQTILNSTVLSAVYGGLMAGLFEETGRLLAFKTVLKKYHAKNINALMYGAGHGGFEAIAILGMTMIGNISMAFMINSEGMTGVLASTPGATEALQAQMETLVAVPAYMFLISVVERISAIILHIALSVLVWFGVKENKIGLYFMAILFHALVDGVASALSMVGINALIIEVLIIVMTLLVGLFAASILKKHGSKA